MKNLTLSTTITQNTVFQSMIEVLSDMYNENYMNVNNLDLIGQYKRLNFFGEIANYPMLNDVFNSIFLNICDGKNTKFELALKLVNQFGYINKTY